MCNYLFKILTILLLMQNAHAWDIDSEIKKSGIKKSDLGMIILKDSIVVYELNKDEKFVPASLSKVLTGIASLKVFNPDERITTSIKSNIKANGSDILEAPLYLVGNGDPSFISENMWVLVNNFKRTGVKKVKGPIVIDESIFDNEYFDKSRQSLRVDRAYDSPVSGVSFNWNSVNVYIRPSKKGKTANVYADPESEYFKIKNTVKTTSGNKSSISVSMENNKKGETLIVSGNIGEDSGEVVKYFSVEKPYEWVGKNLIQFLEQAGISVENKEIKNEKSKKNLNTLAEVKGWTFFEMIDGMMKYSNNFIAESLTKLIAVRKGHKEGSIAHGIQEIKKIIGSYGINEKSYDFFNPSGFSNKNKISPFLLGSVLEKAKEDFSISSYLLSAFAVPGGEGTLSRRILPLSNKRSVRAKTGLLSGVTGLSGYFVDNKGSVNSFVFIYNGNGKESEARSLFDKILLKLNDD